MPISRRDILKSLSLTAVAGSVLRVIPLQAAEYAHHMVPRKKRGPKTTITRPKFFSPHAYKTLRVCATRSFRRTKMRKAQSRREHPNSSI